MNSIDPLRYFDYKDGMKILLAALILFSAQAQAATFESLTEKALREGTVSETIFGFTKSIERRIGSQVAYFTLDIDLKTGQPKRFSAVVENWQETPEGKFEIDQSLFYFTPVGELAFTGRNLILLKQDKSLESIKEIQYGEAPQPAELELWNSLLKSW